MTTSWDRAVGGSHAVEYRWIDRLRTAPLFAYRLPAALFYPIGEPEPYAVVCTEPVQPLGPAEAVGDLLGLHEAAGIQLRVLDNLWCFWDQVTASTLGYRTVIFTVFDGTSEGITSAGWRLPTPT